MECLALRGQSMKNEVGQWFHAPRICGPEPDGQFELSQKKKWITIECYPPCDWIQSPGNVWRNSPLQRAALPLVRYHHCGPITAHGSLVLLSPKSVSQRYRSSLQGWPRPVRFHVTCSDLEISAAGIHQYLRTLFCVSSGTKSEQLMLSSSRWRRGRTQQTLTFHTLYLALLHFSLTWSCLIV